MQTVTNNVFVKIAAAVAGLAMVASMAFAFVPLAQAQTTAQLQAEISTLLAQIQALQTQLSGVSSSGSTVSNTSGSTSQCSFTMSLTIGSRGADVTCLQNYLTTGGYFTYSGGSTGYFGPITRKAVAAWQAANGVAPAVGYFGPISQAKYASLTAAVASTGNTGSTGTTGSTGSTGTTLTGNGLQVSLSSNSPNGKVLIAGQGIGNLAEFTFSNPTSASINVTNLSFKRIGVSNDSTMTNVYLYNGAQRITDSAGITNSKFTFNNSAGLFTVPAGSTYTVAVRSDIALANTSGQQIGVALTSVGSNGTLDSSVSFPINGGLQAISSASLAGVDFGSNVLPTGSATSPQIAPQNGYSVWQDTVSVSTNPVKLSTMTFTNLGSANASSVTNLRLYIDGTQVGQTVPQMNANRTVTFDMSASPVLLSESSHVIKVLADISPSAASRTVQFSVQRSSDAMFIDSQLGQPVTPTNSGSPFSSVTSGGTVNVQSTGVSGVSVSKDPASPINNVSVGATDVNWGTFDLLASGEPTKVKDLYVCAATTGTNSGTGLVNGKIMVNGVQVGSTKPITECITGSQYFSLGSSLILPASQTTKVSVYADAKNASSANIGDAGTVLVKLVAATSNAQGQYSFTSTSVPGTTKLANSITLSNASLSAAAATGYGNQTLVAGANDVKLGSFVLSAGSTEGVNVNTITLTLSSSVIAGEISNLKLVDSSTGSPIGTVIPTPSMSNGFSTNLTVPASGTKTINIYGNILSGAVTPIIFSVDGAGTTGTGAITGLSSSVTNPVPLQIISTGNGTLAVGIGASNPNDANIIAGVSNQLVGDFSFAASNSSFSVKKLQVNVTGGNAVNSVSLQYKDENGTTQTVSQALTGTSTQFSNLSFYVPANGTADVQVQVSTPTTLSAGAGISGQAITVALDMSSATTFQAINDAGATAATISTPVSSVASGNGTMYVRKSVPTFERQTLTTQPASGQAIYQVAVTADSANSVALDQLTFNVATSSGLVVNGFNLYDVTGGSAVTPLSGTVNITASGPVKITFTNPQQIAAGQTKVYQLIPSTVTGWTTGASLTVSLAQDTASTTNATATSLVTSNNVVWSDLSLSGIVSANSADWTNGYLLRDFVNDVQTYTHN